MTLRPLAPLALAVAAALAACDEAPDGAAAQAQGAAQPLVPTRPTGQVVAYHSACSMQHGQQISVEPKVLLRQAGFTVRDVPEGHICCGSAGTYNLLQPELAARLRDRKVANIAATEAAIIATGNIGCITQIGSASDIPIVHTIELLDWATGGPQPRGVAGFAPETATRPVQERA